MTDRSAAGQHLAHLGGRLGTAAGHQVLVGGRAAAVTQVVRSLGPSAAPYPAVGARGHGVREVQRVVRVVAVQRVWDGANAESPDLGHHPAYASVPGVWPAPKNSVRSENMFNGHHHGAGRF